VPHYHRNERDIFIEHLAVKYPACFFVDPSHRRPLKANIIDDLEKQRVLDREKLAQAIDWYTSHFSYRHSLIAGNERVNLDGRRAGTVTPLEQTEAQKWIADRKREVRGKDVPIVPTAKLNGAHVITKPKLPAAEPVFTKELPLLDDIVAAIDVARAIFTQPRLAPMQKILLATTLKEIVNRAETALRSFSSDSSE
jgi:ProQ/FINO family